jgi:hypothetical protein
LSSPSPPPLPPPLSPRRDDGFVHRRYDGVVVIVVVVVDAIVLIPIPPSPSTFILGGDPIGADVDREAIQRDVDRASEA